VEQGGAYVLVSVEPGKNHEVVAALRQLINGGRLVSIPGIGHVLIVPLAEAILAQTTVVAAAAGRPRLRSPLGGRAYQWWATSITSRDPSPGPDMTKTRSGSRARTPSPSVVCPSKVPTKAT